MRSQTRAGYPSRSMGHPSYATEEVRIDRTLTLRHPTHPRHDTRCGYTTTTRTHRAPRSYPHHHRATGHAYRRTPHHHADRPHVHVPTYHAHTRHDARCECMSGGGSACCARRKTHYRKPSPQGRSCGRPTEATGPFAPATCSHRAIRAAMHRRATTCAHRGLLLRQATAPRHLPTWRLVQSPDRGRRGVVAQMQVWMVRSPPCGAVEETCVRPRRETIRHTPESRGMGRRRGACGIDRMCHACMRAIRKST